MCNGATAAAYHTLAHHAAPTNHAPEHDTRNFPETVRAFVPAARGLAASPATPARVARPARPEGSAAAGGGELQCAALDTGGQLGSWILVWDDLQ